MKFPSLGSPHGVNSSFSKTFPLKGAQRKKLIDLLQPPSAIAQSSLIVLSVLSAYGWRRPPQSNTTTIVLPSNASPA